MVVLTRGFLLYLRAWKRANPITDKRAIGRSNLTVYPDFGSVEQLKFGP